MNAIPDAIAQALAPFTPPEPPPAIGGVTPKWNGVYWVYDDVPLEKCELTDEQLREQLPAFEIDTVKSSLVVLCPACDGGWRDTANGVVMCGQCRGSGVRATAGGEP